MFSSFDEKKDLITNYPSSDIPNVTLDTHKWFLTTIYRDNGYTQLLTYNAFINFDSEKGSVGGNGSCNSFGSKIILDGNTISFKNMFSTKMYCSDEQSTENEFLNKLQKVTRYEIKGKNLLLYAGDKLVLEFV